MRSPNPLQVFFLALCGLTTAAVASHTTTALSFRGQPFDLVVAPGQTLIIDTSTALLTSSSGETRTFVNGEIFVDNLEVQQAGQILAQGPNALRFFVNNSVKVHGSISVNGASAKDVSTLLTAGAWTQPGAAGQCGGGDGGVGNPDITQSSAKGGTGLGPDAIVNGGGVGGESGLIALSTSSGFQCNEAEDRHPAGGGGGSFGTMGERGFDGTNGAYTSVGICWVTDGKSAVNSAHRPFGGAAGPTPFVNIDATDNFLGWSTRSNVVRLVDSGPFALVPKNATFSSADIGRFVAVYKTIGSWEDTSIGCIADPQSVSLCPRSKCLIRKITQINFDGSAMLSQPLPAFVAPNDVAVIYRAETTVNGELSSRVGGAGGGAGGNAVTSTSFPNPLYAVQDKSGAGGAGAGGVLEIYCYGTVDLAGGTLTANGGKGAAGENSLGIDRVGGGSGGASGGLIRVQSASSVDLTNATIFARGGGRGAGCFNVEKDPVIPATPNGIGHGGRGGKGIVQIHAPFDDAGNVKITFAASEPSSSRFDPAPIFCVPEFFEDPARQRAVWFGQ